MNSQGNTQQKEKWWSYNNTQLQTILESNSNKNSMALAPVEWNKGPGYESTKLCPLYF
jgi:hypothetical protein